MLFPSCKVVAFRCGVLGLSMLLLAGCEEAGQQQDSAVLTEGEVEVSPSAGESNIALVSAVKVRFAADVAVGNDSGELRLLVNGDPVAGYTVYSEKNYQLTFQPRDTLKPNTQYVVELVDVVTYDGAVVPAQSWSFKTADAVGMTAQWVLDSCMSTQEVALLAAVNTERAKGLACNGLPVDPAPALSWHCDLAAVAQEHSSDLAHMGIVGEVGSNGKGTAERVSEVGVVWRGVAENAFVIDESHSAAEIVSASLSRQQQCENLLNPKLTHMGAAASPSLDGQGHQFWVQLLVQQ